MRIAVHSSLGPRILAVSEHTETAGAPARQAELQAVRATSLQPPAANCGGMAGGVDTEAGRLRPVAAAIGILCLLRESKGLAVRRDDAELQAHDWSECRLLGRLDAHTQQANSAPAVTFVETSSSQREVA
ncbi:hypothetical protein AK812_SmicGene3713 [Symbiodinium microadriaticum]|uniref:Uncharacterized protein n=1 Tax=Symbiodinium microadriaticum TaxID=2951 RepID=A0A1Q9EYA4_SYMMI|nr:hypothetical protein AK812_SmicGene3713 [Symbiodinium microadriaticum]